MATSDDDALMIDVASTTTTTSTAQTSQPTRTDHERNYYFLPTGLMPRSRPHVSQNLISTFGLDRVADNVRRTDPATGEKINKLRKSYEGIVKKLHLAGSNKPVVAYGQWLEGPVESPGLLDIPEEKWANEVPAGRKQVSEKSAADLLAKLDRAVTMAPGKPDDHDKWKKLLGDDFPKPKVAPIAGLRGSVSARPSAQPSPKMGPQQRVQRANAKRSYSDHSFTGYEDTFDRDEDVSNMTEEEARSAGPLKKKRRKVPDKSRAKKKSK